MEDLRVGDVVRYEGQIWRTADVSLYGHEEVGIVLLRPDNDDQLYLNMHVGQIVELIEPSREP